MSKGNLFLGQARGKVGDIVFTRGYGEQVTRARNRAPKNPQTPLQQLQRICLTTACKAYSLMQAICDHSFEGLSVGTPCQSEFTRLNIDKLRQSLAYELAFPEDQVMLDSVAYNFNQKGDNAAELNPYIISRGSLPSLQYVFFQSEMKLEFKSQLSAPTTASYADVVEALGVQRGDQLTFVSVTYDNSVSNTRCLATGFKFARIILEPADGDMSVAFLSGTEGNYAVNAPNPKNEGIVKISGIQASQLGIAGVNLLNIPNETPILGGVILSRLTGNVWKRSSQSLIWLAGSNAIPNTDLFGDAYLSYKPSADSSLYLNQAE